MTIIYTLAHPITKEIRYVGKTKNFNKRRYCHNNINYQKSHKTHLASWLKNILNDNLKPIMEIIDIVEDSEWVFTEIYWICQFKAWGFNLVNHSTGGEGPINYKWTNEMKIKHSLKLKGKNVWTKGSKLSEEHKNNIGLANKGKMNNPKVKLKGGEHNSAKKIHQICPKTLRIIETFNCIKDATIKINIKCQSSISNCLKDKHKTAGGFFWILK